MVYYLYSPRGCGTGGEVCDCSSSNRLHFIHRDTFRGCKEKTQIPNASLSSYRMEYKFHATMATVAIAYPRTIIFSSTNGVTKSELLATTKGKGANTGLHAMYRLSHTCANIRNTSISVDNVPNSHITAWGTDLKSWGEDKPQITIITIIKAYGVKSRTGWSIERFALRSDAMMV